MERSFIKNGKEWKERNVLLKRTDAQPWEIVKSGTIDFQFLYGFHGSVSSFFPNWIMQTLEEEKRLLRISCDYFRKRDGLLSRVRIGNNGIMKNKFPNAKYTLKKLYFIISPFNTILLGQDPDPVNYSGSDVIK